MTEPRRVPVDWGYGADGISCGLTTKEKELPRASGGRWSGVAPAPQHQRIRAGSDRLTSELLDDLQEGNDT